MKSLKRTLCMVLALVLMLGTLSVGAYAVAPMAEDLTTLEREIAKKGLDDLDMVSLLSSALSSVGRDIHGMTVNDILFLSAEEMDDVVAYIFAGLKAFGVNNVDSTYEKISSNKIINWFVNTYFKKDTLLKKLEKEIRSKGLDEADMVSLLSSAMQSIDKDVRTMTVNEILSLSAAESDAVVTYIFMGLKSLAVFVMKGQEQISSDAVLKWFVDTYYRKSDIVINLPRLEKAIANKGLDATDMISLLSSALESAGYDMRMMSVNDILAMQTTEMDYVVAYIINELKKLGVKEIEDYETLSSNKLMNWFVNTYYKNVAFPAGAKIMGVPTGPVRWGKTIKLTAQITGGYAKEIYWFVDGKAAGAGETFYLSVRKNVQVQVKAFIEDVDFVESEIIDVQVKSNILLRLLNVFRNYIENIWNWFKSIYGVSLFGV